MFRQLLSSGLFLLNYSGMGLPDDEIKLSVLLGSSYYNTKYTVSSLLVLGQSRIRQTQHLYYINTLWTGIFPSIFITNH
jgi:hypothetical protein